MFQKAVKREAKLRLAIAGPSGSGKTYTALAIGTALGGKVAVIDTEHGSAAKYADLFEFDTLPIGPGAMLPDGSPSPFQNYHPQNFVKGIGMAIEAGYDAVILDSLSHAWNGTGGVLDIVEQASKRFKGNSYAGWQEGTPAHNALIEGVVSANCHIIATMRSKQEYILVERNGKQAPQKVGMAPVQRDGFEYEFDVFMDMDIENNAIVSKTRCPALTGAVISKPGRELAETLREWLSGAEPIDYHEAALNAQTLEAFSHAAYQINGTQNAFESPQRLADWYRYVADEFDWVANGTMLEVLSQYVNAVVDGVRVKEAVEKARSRFQQSDEEE